jgi:hypothetical protein
MRLRILRTYRLNRVTDLHHFDADPYPAFHLNVDPDPTSRFNSNPDSVPAHDQSDVNLRPLFYRSSASRPPLWRPRPSTAQFLASKVPKFGL